MASSKNISNVEFHPFLTDCSQVNNKALNSSSDNASQSDALSIHNEESKKDIRSISAIGRPPSSFDLFDDAQKKTLDSNFSTSVAAVMGTLRILRKHASESIFKAESNIKTNKSSEKSEQNINSSIPTFSNVEMQYVNMQHRDTPSDSTSFSVSNTGNSSNIIPTNKRFSTAKSARDLILSSLRPVSDLAKVPSSRSLASSIPKVSSNSSFSSANPVFSDQGENKLEQDITNPTVNPDIGTVEIHQDGSLHAAEALQQTAKALVYAWTDDLASSAANALATSSALQSPTRTPDLESSNSFVALDSKNSTFISENKIDAEQARTLHLGLCQSDSLAKLLVAVADAHVAEDLPSSALHSVNNGSPQKKFFSASSNSPAPMQLSPVNSSPSTLVGPVRGKSIRLLTGDGIDLLETKSLDAIMSPKPILSSPPLLRSKLSLASVGESNKRLSSLTEDHVVADSPTSEPSMLKASPYASTQAKESALCWLLPPLASLPPDMLVPCVLPSLPPGCRTRLVLLLGDGAEGLPVVFAPAALLSEAHVPDEALRAALPPPDEMSAFLVATAAASLLRHRRAEAAASLAAKKSRLSNSKELQSTSSLDDYYKSRSPSDGSGDGIDALVEEFDDDDADVSEDVSEEEKNISDNITGSGLKKFQSKTQTAKEDDDGSTAAAAIMGAVFSAGFESPDSQHSSRMSSLASIEKPNGNLIFGAKSMNNLKSFSNKRSTYSLRDEQMRKSTDSLVSDVLHSSSNEKFDGMVLGKNKTFSVSSTDDHLYAVSESDADEDNDEERLASSTSKNYSQATNIHLEEGLLSRPLDISQSMRTFAKDAAVEAAQQRQQHQSKLSSLRTHSTMTLPRAAASAGVISGLLSPSFAASLGGKRLGRGVRSVSEDNTLNDNNYLSREVSHDSKDVASSIATAVAAALHRGGLEALAAASEGAVLPLIFLPLPAALAAQLASQIGAATAAAYAAAAVARHGVSNNNQSEYIATLTAAAAAATAAKAASGANQRSDLRNASISSAAVAAAAQQLWSLSIARDRKASTPSPNPENYFVHDSPTPSSESGSPNHLNTHIQHAVENSNEDERLRARRLTRREDFVLVTQRVSKNAAGVAVKKAVIFRAKDASGSLSIAGGVGAGTNVSKLSKRGKLKKEDSGRNSSLLSNDSSNHSEKDSNDSPVQSELVHVDESTNTEDINNLETKGSPVSLLQSASRLSPTTAQKQSNIPTIDTDNVAGITGLHSSSTEGAMSASTTSTHNRSGRFVPFASSKLATSSVSLLSSPSYQQGMLSNDSVEDTSSEDSDGLEDMAAKPMERLQPEQTRCMKRLDSDGRNALKIRLGNASTLQSPPISSPNMSKLVQSMASLGPLSPDNQLFSDNCKNDETTHTKVDDSDEEDESINEDSDFDSLLDGGDDAMRDVTDDLDAVLDDPLRSTNQPPLDMDLEPLEDVYIIPTLSSNEDVILENNNAKPGTIHKGVVNSDSDDSFTDVNDTFKTSKGMAQSKFSSNVIVSAPVPAPAIVPTFYSVSAPAAAPLSNNSVSGTGKIRKGKIESDSDDSDDDDEAPPKKPSASSKLLGRNPFSSTSSTTTGGTIAATTSTSATSATSVVSTPSLVSVPESGSLPAVGSTGIIRKGKIESDSDDSDDDDEAPPKKPSASSKLLGRNPFSSSSSTTTGGTIAATTSTSATSATSVVSTPSLVSVPESGSLPAVGSTGIIRKGKIESDSDDSDKETLSTPIMKATPAPLSIYLNGRSQRGFLTLPSGVEYRGLQCGSSNDIVCPQENCIVPLGLKFGVAEDQGRRSTMEDRCMCAPDLITAAGNKTPSNSLSTAFFGVFDGHDGDACATYLSRRLHANLARTDGTLVGDAVTALIRAFVHTDRVFLKRQIAAEAASADRVRQAAAMGKQRPMDFKFSGSTAVVMLARLEHTDDPYEARDSSTIASDEDEDDESNQVTPIVRLYIAHVGDCRAVLSHGGIAIPLTNDHKPSTRPDEVARIEAAGGWVHNGRLHGVLAVSRAFGDAEHKILKERFWEQSFVSDPLIVAPDIRVHSVRPRDEFWHVMVYGMFFQVNKLLILFVVSYEKIMVIFNVQLSNLYKKLLQCLLLIMYLLLLLH
jgi:serine/threonine protein phosphatase PrpC